MKQYSIPFLLIIFLTVFIWSKILFQVPLGEGYYYFDFHQRIVEFWEYDNFAKVLFTLLIPIFKDNLILYMTFQLLIMTLVHISFFAFVNFLTKNKIIALIATIFFLSSFTGSFEMLGTASYHRLVQRVINLIPLFFSFIFLAKFLENSKFKFYLLSIALFTLSLWMAHFSTFLLPLFLIYPVIFALFQKQKILILKSIVMGIPFLVINLFMISKDHLTPNSGIGSFFASNNLLLIAKEMTLQFANMILPIPLIEKIISITTPFTDTLVTATIPIIVIFILGIFLIFKRIPTLLPLYLTSLLMIPILLFLNLYLGKIKVEYNIGGHMDYFVPTNYHQREDFNFVRGDRAYYLPTFFSSIILTLLLWSLFSKSKITFFLPFTLLYLVYNTNLIWSGFEKIQPLCDSTKNYLKFIDLKSKEFNNETTIVVPQDLMWPAPLIRTSLNLNQIRFILKKPGWESEVENIDKYYHFEYDYRNNAVIDLTQKQYE